MLTKLLLTVLATVLLLLHTRPIGLVASVAAVRALSSTDLRPARTQLVFDAAAALAMLLLTTTLSVFKPRGLTSYGRRVQARQ